MGLCKSVPTVDVKPDVHDNTTGCFEYDSCPCTSSCCIIQIQKVEKSSRDLVNTCVSGITKS